MTLVNRSAPLILASLVLVPAAASAQSGSRADDTLDVVAQFEIQSPEPSTSGYVFTRMGVSETLVDADAEGRLVPGFATGWEVGEDGLDWRFAIRSDVTFHDGSPLTPESVVNALEIARDKPAPLAALPIEGIEDR